MSGAFLTLVAALAMEPIAAWVHRFFGHGPGWSLHVDHHQPRCRWERNDLIPLGFAGLAMVAFAFGAARPGLRWLFWIALGVTVYGGAYGLIHDIYIHRRLPLLPARVAMLEPWRRAHLEHHERGTAPFGVLLPLRPHWRWGWGWGPSALP